MKNKCVSKFFISSVFTSDNQCPIYSLNSEHLITNSIDLCQVAKLGGLS